MHASVPPWLHVASMSTNYSLDLHIGPNRIIDQEIYWFIFSVGLLTLLVSHILPVESSCLYYVELPVGILNRSSDMSIQSMHIPTHKEIFCICTLSILLVPIHIGRHSWWLHVINLQWTPFLIHPFYSNRTKQYLSQFVKLTNLSHFIYTGFSICLISRSSAYP